MIYDYFDNIEFGQPYLLALLLLIPVIIIWYIRSNKKRQSSLLLSTTSARGLGSFKASLRYLPFILRMISLVFIIIALAKPQVRNEQQRTEGEGIDIVLCLDVSGSMTAQDLKPNRMEAAKKVAVDFVNERPTDRIGVVIFSGESFTQCPLTTDNAVLVSAIKNIRNGMLEDGTAIGAGLGTSVDRLRNSDARSKVVVLLTDGENNGGLIDPKTAKEIAKAFGIKVYTIGIGTEGFAPQPVNTPMGVVIERQKVSIDEPLLREIAKETGGKYFRATDNASLAAIYDDINALEKSKIDLITSIRFKDKFLPFVIAALFFLILEVLFRYVVLRKFP